MASIRTEQLPSQNTVRRTLYPEILPFNSGFLKVDDLHTIYFEEVGNRQGKPAVFLHGGPGGGLSESYRQYFDPKVWRVVLIDQRGSGKSTPFAETRGNTTWNLVADIEAIRTHLAIDHWKTVFGGSWGSTLALAYAETHPDRVKSLVLRGIFTLRRDELLFFYQKGASFLFPEHFAEFASVIPEAERGDLIQAFHKRLTGQHGEEERLRCAKAWTKWEMATSRLFVDPENLAKGEEDKFALAFASIENHYFVNEGFFKEDGQLLKDAHKIAHIPTTIVHGRYDVVCPIETAFMLYDNLVKAGSKNVELIVIPDSGHSMKEPGILSELVKATDKYASL